MKTKGDFAGKICVVVGTVTDDLRLYEVPPLKVRPCKSLFWISCRIFGHSDRLAFSLFYNARISKSYCSRS